MSEKPTKTGVSAAMLQTMEQVARGEVVTKRPTMQALIRRGLVEAAWSGSLMCWMHPSLTEAGEAAVGVERLAEIAAEVAAAGVADQEERERRAAADKERVERLASAPAPPSRVERPRVVASRVSGQLKRAGWNPGYQDKDVDGLQIHQIETSEVRATFRRSDHPSADLAETADELVRTLRWLGYTAEVSGEPSTTRASVRVTLGPRVERTQHSFEKCPLCDRPRQPLLKVRDGVWVFSTHKWLDRVTPCEGSRLTPEQAQAMADGLAPSPGHRLTVEQDR